MGSTQTELGSLALAAAITTANVARKIPILLFTLVLLFSACNETTKVVRSSNIYVVDGDTIDVGGQRYRLIGYDTPETYRAQCDSERKRGDAATARLRAMVAAVSEVTLQIQDGKDKYQRGLATLLINNRDVGSLLINEGLATCFALAPKTG